MCIGDASFCIFLVIFYFTMHWYCYQDSNLHHSFKDFYTSFLFIDQWTQNHVLKHFVRSFLNLLTDTRSSSICMKSGRILLVILINSLWYQLTVSLVDFTQNEDNYIVDNMITVGISCCIESSNFYLVICRIYCKLWSSIWSTGICYSCV